MNIFERATRSKLRFQVVTAPNAPAGLLSAEDLYDLDLGICDAMYMALNKKLQQDETVSLIRAPKSSETQKADKLRFDILKHVIETRLADKERAAKAAATRAKRQRVLALMEKRDNEELDDLSKEDLQKLYDDMAPDTEG